MRGLSENKEKDGVRVDFVVTHGREQTQTADIQEKVTVLGSDSDAGVAKRKTFATELDRELEAAGEEALQMRPEQVTFDEAIWQDDVLTPPQPEQRQRQRQTGDEHSASASAHYLHYALTFLLVLTAACGAVAACCVWARAGCWAQRTEQGREGAALPQPLPMKHASCSHEATTKDVDGDKQMQITTKPSISSTE